MFDRNILEELSIDLLSKTESNNRKVKLVIDETNQSNITLEDIYLESVNISTSKKRVENLFECMRYLIDAIDVVHNKLCPDQNGSWQDRTEQVIKACKQ